MICIFHAAQIPAEAVLIQLFARAGYPRSGRCPGEISSASTS